MTGRADIVCKPARKFGGVHDGAAFAVYTWSNFLHLPHMRCARTVAVFTSNRQIRERRVKKTAIAIRNRLGVATVAANASWENRTAQAIIVEFIAPPYRPTSILAIKPNTN